MDTTPARELQPPPNRALRTPFAHITESRDGVKSSPFYPSPGDHFNPQLARRLSTPLKKDAEWILPLDVHQERGRAESDANSTSDVDYDIASPPRPRADAYEVDHENDEFDSGYKEDGQIRDTDVDRGSSPFQDDLQMQNGAVLKESETAIKQVHPVSPNEDENGLTSVNQRTQRHTPEDNELYNAPIDTEKRDDSGLEDESNSDSDHEVRKPKESFHSTTGSNINQDHESNLAIEEAVMNEDDQDVQNAADNTNAENFEEVQFETHREALPMTVRGSPSNTRPDVENQTNETNIERSPKPSIDESQQSEGDTALSSFSAISTQRSRPVQIRDSPAKRASEQSPTPRKLPRLSPEPFSTSIHSPRWTSSDYAEKPSERSNSRQANGADTPNSMKLAFPQMKERALRDISNVSHSKPHREHKIYTEVQDKSIETERRSHKGPLVDESLVSLHPTTPGSKPSITQQEFETVKTSYEFEISALKKSRDTEINSLREKLLGAEKREAETMEFMQQELESRMKIEGDRDEWRRRTGGLQAEMDSILLDAFEKDRREKELTDKVTEVEGANQKLQERVSSLEKELSATRKSLQSAESSLKLADNSHSGITQEDVDKQVGDAVTKVAADLHVVYKEKHETKVAALKKSYASRWEKRIKEIETKLNAAMEENTQLKMSQVETKPPTENQSSWTPADEEKMTQERDKLSEEKQALETRVDELSRELTNINGHVESLQLELKTERMEKDELVATVEEWLAIQMPPDSEEEVPRQDFERTTKPEQPHPEAQPQVPPRSQQFSQDNENRTIPSKRPLASDSAHDLEESSSHAWPPPSKTSAPTSSQSSRFLPNPSSSSSRTSRKHGFNPRVPRLSTSSSNNNLSGVSGLRAPSPKIATGTSAGAAPSLLHSRSGIMDSIKEMDEGHSASGVN